MVQILPSKTLLLTFKEQLLVFYYNQYTVFWCVSQVRRQYENMRITYTVKVLTDLRRW